MGRGAGHALLCLWLASVPLQYSSRVGLPGAQGIVGHIGKVQKGEEVLGANHAKAFGEVGMHPRQRRSRLVGNHYGVLAMNSAKQCTEERSRLYPSPIPQWLPPFPYSPSHSEVGGAGPDFPRIYGDQDHGIPFCRNSLLRTPWAFPSLSPHYSQEQPVQVCDGKGRQSPAQAA